MQNNLGIGSDVPPMLRTPIYEIVERMPPLVRFAFESAMKEADMEYEVCTEQGYTTDGKYKSKILNAYTKPYYLGSISLTHWQVFKLFLPLVETPLGVVKHWPSLEECVSHWQTIPEGLQRYMQSPVALADA